MTKLFSLALILYMITLSYAFLVLTPIVYNKKDGDVSESCNQYLQKYNEMVNDCLNDKCKDDFSESFIESVRDGCNGNEIDKKIYEQIESTYLFNSVSQLEVDGVNCSIYSVNIGQSIESRCACMKKMIDYLEEFTTKHENSILTSSIEEFKSEISDIC
ncbi:hypothetical protein PIROE2DRAFT_57256 [Piromyces sp. E2]|nr:hypothetical protein PIROE2DRAFT_57256 [Piromyces sp. E2]|eukprot:OUM69707.1 hypothetical protein PIROE2DRAFT_57256 [Piromyces sp. E2]